MEDAAALIAAYIVAGPGGEPYIRRTRIPVAVVCDNLRDGMTAREILAEHPSLTERSIRAALAYGSCPRWLVLGSADSPPTVG
jgi:uncharacterized protein (DUF433 family)